MPEIALNEYELDFIELFRLALSEEEEETRLRAIRSVRHEVIATRLTRLRLEHGPGWFSDPTNAEFLEWVLRTEDERRETAFELSQIGRRHEEKNQLKLKIAEHIGILVWMSVQDGKFEGIHTSRGILEQVRNDAKGSEVRGARDIDTLRKAWNKYRGVVHLGLAIDYALNNPCQDIDVLELAECFRQGLSQNCPKGTSAPYVDPRQQFSFIYLSKLWGPRFRNRGLPFYVD